MLNSTEHGISTAHKTKMLAMSYCTQNEVITKTCMLSAIVIIRALRVEF